MIKTGPNTPIISACNRLIWTAGRQPEVMELIDRMDTIDQAVKMAVLAGAPPIRFRGLDVRSGSIDGIIDIEGIGAKLLYVAVSFDSEPLDAHLLHCQRQLYDLNQRKETHLHMDSCFMLVVNKCAGTVRERVVPYRDEFAIDFQHIYDAELGSALSMREMLNDSCNFCPLRMDCDTYGKWEDGEH
ncbi:putative CRISPR-associated exonuclease [Pantoea phage Nafs113]|nr:putative CRISPR-associated exonuclease [Pantoea phage Nafs113]